LFPKRSALREEVLHLESDIVLSQLNFRLRLVVGLPEGASKPDLKVVLA
jgi:hypothetical protein